MSTSPGLAAGVGPQLGEPARATLSVIIITLNEAAHIGECLDSVAFADEIIVVDSGSSDGTREIAQARGAKVSLTDDWPGFGPQKNRALELAGCDWVLSIDADERVTPELAAEIQGVLEGPVGADTGDGTVPGAFRIARMSNFGGRWIRHSGWWPDHVLRLFRRGSARFKDVAVHESVVTDKSVATLKSHFLHYPYDSLEQFIAKINHYSSEAAAMMHARGRRTSVLSAWAHAFWTFVRIYVLRRGFLDGREGFILAMMGAAGSFFRYTKLLFLNKQQPK
ncbi:MAG: glycosyltransferase family 2 protein [Burkholderiaceae bacterium]